MPRTAFSDEHLLTDKEFILELSERQGIAYEDAQEQLKLTLKLLAEVLARDGIAGVDLKPFGRIKLSVFSEREGYGIVGKGGGNPAFYRLILKPSKAVKRALKSKPITPHDQDVAAGRVESRSQKRTAAARIARQH